MNHTYLANLSDDELQEWLTGYALGALEPAEMVAVGEYLQDQPELLAVVQRLEETSAALAFAAPEATPPAHVKAALMTRLQAEAEPRRVTTSTLPDSTSPTMSRSRLTPPPAAGLFGQRTNVRRQSTPRRSRGWRFQDWFDVATGWKVATVASCAALAFFVVTTLQLMNYLSGTATELERQQRAVSALEEQLTTLTTENDQLQQANEIATQELAAAQTSTTDLETTLQQIVTELQLQEQQLASLLDVNQVVALDSTRESAATGALFVGTNSLVLVVHGLQPLPADQTYELWLIPEDSNPVSAGLVQVSREESPNITTDIQLTTPSFVAVGLSIEGSGGSSNPDGPEGPVVMLGEKSA